MSSRENHNRVISKTNNPWMKALFLTISDRMFFPGTLAAVNSILRYHPDARIAVVSSGEFNQPLTQPQIDLLRKGGVSVHPHDRFQKAGRVLGAWQLKAYAASDLSEGQDLLIGFDSDLIFCSNVSDVMQQCLVDGKFRGGADGNGTFYGDDYQPYGFSTPVRNPVYMSASCYFCPLTPPNRAILEDWAEKSNQACYGPQKAKVYPGHGDQGVLNAVIFAHTRSTNVELLPNRRWSQHWRYESDVIGFDGEHFLNHSDGGQRMRTFHCGGSDKFWTAKHSQTRRGTGQNQRWPYALFLDHLFLGPLSRWAFDPLQVIPNKFSHLFQDFVFYHQLVRRTHADFHQRWNSIGHHLVGRCCESSGIRRFMTLNGDNSMDQYTRLAKQLPDRCKIAEIGSFVGGSILTLAIALLHKNPTLYSIESFMGNNDGKMDGGNLPTLAEYLRNIKEKFPFLNIHSIQLPSHLACDEFEDGELDMVFIDGNHSREAVCDDIERWRPKLKPGGILAGDDISWDGVREAVREKCPNFQTGSHLWWDSVSAAHSTPVETILVTGFHHSGTSILRKIIGNHPEIFDVLNERQIRHLHRWKNEARQSGQNKLVLKAVSFGAQFLEFYRQFDKAVLIIRNPFDVMASLTLRLGKTPKVEEFRRWERYAQAYQQTNHPNLIKVRYEDLFDHGYSTLQEVFKFLHLPWRKEVATENHQRRVPINCNKIPDQPPERTQQALFRSWQINQPFVSTEGANRHVLDMELLDLISLSPWTEALNYTPAARQVV